MSKSRHPTPNETLPRFSDGRTTGAKAAGEEHNTHVAERALSVIRTILQVLLTPYGGPVTISSKQEQVTVHDQNRRVFHIWIADANEVRHYCGERVVVASVSPEWALKIKGESICADCLRILQIEMDAQNPPGPLSTAAPKLPPR